MTIRRLIGLVLTTGALALAPPSGFTADINDNTPPGIGLTARGHGWMLNTTEGKTLYTYMKDPVSGAPSCTGDCIAMWPPLMAPAEAKTGKEWSVVERDDGARQWAFRGKPLYTYTGDAVPGEMNGDELLQQWYVAVKPIPLPPGFKTYKTPAGYLLADQKNMTLYTSSVDSENKSACDAECAKTWLPVEAWWRAQATVDNWAVLDRADGTRQWSYNGQPLYRYSGDFAPGETAGDGLDSWSAVVLERPPPVPEWVTTQKSDAGALLADSNGKTLYMHDLTGARAFGVGIGRDMATPHLWTPVFADNAADSIGHWSVVSADNGRYQWAYKGLKLYVHERDTQPGDLNGQRSSDRYWRTIMKDGQVMPGSGR